MIANLKGRGDWNIRTDHGVPGCEGMSVSAVAKAHGISRATVAQRYSRGDRGMRLVRPLESRGKPRKISGKSFTGWINWFSFWGTHTPALGTITSSYYEKRGEGMTDDEIVSMWKERWAASQGSPHGHGSEREQRSARA